MSDWPEHEKLEVERKLQDFTQEMGMALDGGSPYVLCTLEKAECTDCDGLGKDFMDRQCERCEDEETGESTGFDPFKTRYVPVPRLEEALAVLVGVDYAEMQAEKERMYQELKAANA